MNTMMNYINLLGTSTTQMLLLEHEQWADKMEDYLNGLHEPKTMKIALEHLDWLTRMQSKLAEFERNKMWRLIPTPNDVSVVGLKWVFRNKLDK